MFWNRKKDTNEELQGLIRTIVKEELKESVDEIITMLSGRMEKLHDKEILFIQDNLKNSTNSIIESFPEEIVGLSPQVDDEDALDKSQEESDHSADSINYTGRRGTTGIYRVHHASENSWVYRYYENDTRKSISSTDLREVEKKVKKANLPWVITDTLLADISFKTSDEYQKHKRVNRTEILHKSNDELYSIPKSYRNYLKPIFENGRVKFGYNARLYFETSLFLKIFYNVSKTLFVRDYHALKEIQNNSTMNPNLFFSVVYGVNTDIKKGYGDYLKLAFEIFEQDYEVPFFIDFSEKTGNIYINGKFTGIPTIELKSFINQLNNSLHPKCDIVMLMHNNPKVNQRYLFYCLMNYGNPKLLELLE